jgi:dTDP-glucose pyrophosphorylase
MIAQGDRWSAPPLSIVIPMAGRGERFARRGYGEPKPLIPVHGHAMIRLVISNLRPSTVPHRFIFVCLEEHLRSFPLRSRLELWSGGCEVVAIPEVTSGAAATVLAAREHFETDAPLMIANCDQLVRVSMERYLDQMAVDQLDGLIMTMPATDPKWSFVRRGPSGQVVEVAEKVPISGEATVGIYNFRHGRDFCRAADAMINKGARTNGEYYVAPVYNELIAAGMRVGAYELRSPCETMHGLGIPEDLESFQLDPSGRALLDELGFR